MRGWRRAHEKFLYRGDWWWVARWHDQVPEEEEAVRLSRWEAADLVARWCRDLHVWPRMLDLYQEEFGPIYRAPSDAEVEHQIEPALRRAFERGELVAVREPRKRIAFRRPPDDPPPPPPAPRPPVRQKHYLDVTVQNEDGSAAAGKRYRLQLPDARNQPGLIDIPGRIFNPDVPEGTAFFWILSDKAETIAGEDIAPPTPAPTDTQTFTVRLVDELGVPVSGVPFTMQHGGASDTATTNDDGEAQIADDAAQSAVASFADSAALREGLRDRWNAPRDGDVQQDSDDVTVCELHGDLPSVTIAPGVTQTISVQPYVERGRLIGGYFDTSKSFLLPSGLDGVRAIVSTYGDNDGAALLIVGHTDSTGAADYNDQLSLERANALKDYLTENVDGWLPWYGSTQPAEKRWGVGEDQAMIGALPDAGTRDDSESPIAWYRRTRGMAPGEKPDKPMRRALIAEYMGLEGTSLPDGITVVTHGCGENFPADAVPDGVAEPENRRVEVFFFDGVLGVQPPPTGDNSGPGAVDYPEWVKRAKATRDHELQPTDRLLIRLHDDNAMPITSPVPYRITLGQTAGPAGTSADGWVTVALPENSCPDRILVEWGTPAADGSFPFAQEVAVACGAGTDRVQAGARLSNLGYQVGSDDLFRSAVLQFQDDYQLSEHGIAADGRIPAETKAKLDAIFDGDCDATRPPPESASGDDANEDLPDPIADGTGSCFA